MYNSLKTLRFYLYYIPSMFINNVTDYEVSSCFIFVLFVFFVLILHLERNLTMSASLTAKGPLKNDKDNDNDNNQNTKVCEFVQQVQGICTGLVKRHRVVSFPLIRHF